MPGKHSKLLLLIGLSLAGMLGAGFLKFTAIVNAYNPASPPSADGIIVLTGGKARLEAGLHLLKNNQARRLLISGVNPETSNNALAHRFIQHKNLFTCCIDFDRRAQNTSQNAREAAIWAKQQNFNSLIVVTSDYHMPRAILEFTRTMPHLDLKPYAVANIPQLYNAKLVNTEHLKILITEYAKTMVVYLQKMTYSN